MEKYSFNHYGGRLGRIIDQYRGLSCPHAAPSRFRLLTILEAIQNGNVGIASTSSQCLLMTNKHR